jgi:hypothetical protein
VSVRTSAFTFDQLAARLHCTTGDVADYLERLEIPIVCDLSNSQLSRLDALRRADEKSIQRFEKNKLHFATGRNASQS